MTNDISRLLNNMTWTQGWFLGSLISVLVVILSVTIFDPDGGKNTRKKKEETWKNYLRRTFINTYLGDLRLKWMAIGFCLIFLVLFLIDPLSLFHPFWVESK